MSKQPEHAHEQRGKLTRLQPSRYEIEQRNRRYILIGAAIVGVLTLGLIAAAALQLAVFEPRRVVATVNNVPITVQSLQKRMRLTQQGVMGNAMQLQNQIASIQGSGDESQQFLAQFYQQQLQQIVSQGSAESVAQNSYQQMVDEQLVRMEATKRGITVSPEEVQTELERNFGLFRATLTPFPTLTPEPTTMISGTPVVPPTVEPRQQPTSIPPDTFAYELAKRIESLSALNYTEQDLRESVENELLRQKLKEAFGRQVETSAPHYAFDFVRFNAITDALKAADRLSKNEIRFEALISETNAITSPAPVGNGESVTWTSELRVLDLYGPEVLDLLTYKAINAPTQIVTSTNNGGIYILLPRGRDTRPFATAELEQLKSDSYDKWLAGARADTALVKKEIEPFEVIPAALRKTAADFAARFGQGLPGVPNLPQ